MKNRKSRNVLYLREGETRSGLTAEKYNVLHNEVLTHKERVAVISFFNKLGWDHYSKNKGSILAEHAEELRGSHFWQILHPLGYSAYGESRGWWVKCCKDVAKACQNYLSALRPEGGEA